MTDEPDLGSALRSLSAQGALDLPHPGEGRTAERWRRLAEISRSDVSIARLVEAHVDAVSILHEAGRVATPSALYGVWAAEGSGTPLRLEGGIHPRLVGVKPFCTGAGLVDRALVTARVDGGVALVDVDARDAAIRFDAADWVVPAFAATQTATATFDSVEAGDLVGTTGWYLDRVGFWHGACGPATCWAGGVVGLVDRAVELACAKDPEPHRDAHVGALAAIRWELLALLDRAGHEIDAAPTDLVAARVRARSFRHLVDRAAAEAIDRFGRAFGPRPLVSDHDVIRRIAEVQLYVRQCHAERDLEALGQEFRDS